MNAYFQPDERPIANPILRGILSRECTGYYHSDERSISIRIKGQMSYCHSDETSISILINNMMKGP